MASQWSTSNRSNACHRIYPTLPLRWCYSVHFDQTQLSVCRQIVFRRKRTVLKHGSRRRRHRHRCAYIRILFRRRRISHAGVTVRCCGSYVCLSSIYSDYSLCTYVQMTKRRICIYTHTAYVRLLTECETYADTLLPRFSSYLKMIKIECARDTGT